MSIPVLRTIWGNAPLLTVSVGVIIHDEDGRVLLQRRGDDGLWSVPGGALEPGEDFLTGAHRELLEETGLACPNLTLLPLPDGLQDGPELYEQHHPGGHDVYIVGRRAEGHLPASGVDRAVPDDGGLPLDLRWFPLDALPDLNSNASRRTMNVLRSRAGRPLLPLTPVPAPPPIGHHLMELRKVVGPRPLFSPGANVLVTDAEDRLLLLRHGHTRRWTLPGGNLEPGETFAQTATRELFEETGLQAEHLEALEMFAGPRYRLTYPNGDIIDSVSVLYRASGLRGDLNPQDGEVLDVGWFSDDALPDDEDLHSPVMRASLRWWRSRA